MPPRGRPPKTAKQRQPKCIQFPYQVAIWRQYMNLDQQKKYIKQCSDRRRLGDPPLDVYDFFQEKCGGAQLPAHFPPRDCTWQPAPQQASSSVQTSLALATSPPIVTPLNDFTDGLREALVSDDRPSSPAQQSFPAADETHPTASARPLSHLSTPWNRSPKPQDQAARAHRRHSTALPDQHASDVETPGSVLEQCDDEDEEAILLVDLNESIPIEQNVASGSTGPTRSNPRTPALSLPAREAAISSVDTSSGTSRTGTHQGSPNHRDQSQATATISNQFPDHYVPRLSPSPTAPSSPNLYSPSRVGEAEVIAGDGESTPLPTLEEVSVHDVHQVVHAATRFHCDCREGHEHDVKATQQRFSLGELRRATDHNRCFPPPDTEFPQPFHAKIPVSPADFDHIDYQQYLSTIPIKGQRRTPLCLRSTIPLAAPLEEALHITRDVDSLWLRLSDLSDVTTHLEIAYTAQRHLNITSPQYLPRFSSSTHSDIELHRTAHTLFATYSLFAHSNRLYVYWPHLKNHHKTVVDDAEMARWMNHVVIPALRTLPSYATQDHPQTWQDAHVRAHHRGETQLGGHQGSACLGYTLHQRFVEAFATALRNIIEHAGPFSDLSQFQGFSFVMVGHDSKRAFNNELPGFDCIRQFRQQLSLILRPSYLTSTLFLDHSFADFGVEYNLRHPSTTPTTLLLRRTCLEDRLSSTLMNAAPRSIPSVNRPRMFTTYSLDAAATGDTVLPARAPMSSAIPKIKVYNLHKHCHTTHLRHRYAPPFTYPHLDLLCLTDDLIHEIHQAIPGHFESRKVAAVHTTLQQTLHRLDTSLIANQASHNGVRIEIRQSMRHLLGLLERETAWPSSFDTAGLHHDREHPFVFSVATDDLNAFIRNYLQRMTMALAGQRLDLFGPAAVWNSFEVRHRLSNTAVLLLIMASFFAGTEQQRYTLKAATYDCRKSQRDRLVHESATSIPRPSEVSALDSYMRVGLCMAATIREWGMYWLPHELFTFHPRPQLQAHLIGSITVARPRLLGKAQIHWNAPSHDSRAFEGDVVHAIVVSAARDVAKLSTLDSKASYLRVQMLRIQMWQLTWPIVIMLARGFFRYIASRTTLDPQFQQLDDNEFGVPFNALTYTAVTRLLGAEPTLVIPRKSTHDDAGTAWHQRLQHLFDWTIETGWQKTASFLVDLRRWVKIMKAEGVSDSYLSLWRHDLGYLLRPFVWIVPSYESKKTLFRLDKDTTALKRHRTRWYLPGLVRKGNAVVSLRTIDQKAHLVQVQSASVYTQKVSARQAIEIDPIRLSNRYIMLYTQTKGDPAGRSALEERMQRFECRDVTWSDQRVSPTHRKGRSWVPFYTTNDEFPSSEMEHLQERTTAYLREFIPHIDSSTTNPDAIRTDHANNDDYDNEGYDDEDHNDL